MAVKTGLELVTEFRRFEWVGYTWGGSSPGTGWDCSGACNWITGEWGLLDIPGHLRGTWTSAQGHGPVVADWINWSGVVREPWGPDNTVAGDLIAWGPNQHMGMAFDALNFVSAANPNQGTIEAPIGQFFNYEPWRLRLVDLIVSGGTTVGIPSPAPLPANPMTNWAATIRAAAARGDGAASNLGRFASAIRRE